MKKNATTIASVIVVILVAGALLYIGGGNKSSTTAQPSALDSRYSGTANVPYASLNNLVGKPVPAFSLADGSGKIYLSDSLRGKKTVLFFTEGLMCYPACWNQIVAFTKDVRFRDSNTLVLSVVVESKEDWQKAINQMPELAQAAVLFDSDSTVSKQLGMLTAPSSMHPGSLPGHTYLLVDKNGIIRYVLDDPTMSIRNDQLISEIAKL